MVSVVAQENGGATSEARILQEAFDSGTEAVFEVMADLFADRPARLNARYYVRGLLAPLELKHCATIVESAWHVSPDRLHLPARTRGLGRAGAAGAPGGAGRRTPRRPGRADI